MKLKFLNVLLISGCIILSCKKKDIYEPPITSFSITNVSTYGASDGAINLTVDKGVSPYSYLWSSGQTTKDITDLFAGTYIVTVTDAEGQTTIDTAIITEPTQLSISVEIKDVTISGGANGSIDITVSGGVSPYSYNWNNGENSEDLDNITAGNYTVTVSDINGAEISDTFLVIEPLVISYTSDDVSAFNGSDGSINLLLTGGEEPYIINWSNNLSSVNLNSLKSGCYSVTVTDQRETSRKIQIPVYEPYAPDCEFAEILSETKWYGNAWIRTKIEEKIFVFDPLEKLDETVDFIFVSHSHGDHYNSKAFTSQPLTTIVFAPIECREEIKTVSGIDVITLLPFEDTTVNDVHILAVPAYNIVKVNHPKENNWVGYVVTYNGVSVYHSGDTERIPEMKNFTTDIAFITLGQTYTMVTLNDAVESVKDVQAKLAIPIHYTGYEGTFEDAFTFKELLKDIIPVYIVPKE